MTEVRTKDFGTWAAFLTIAFALIGLLACYATNAAQVPMQRALARDAALDRLLDAKDDVSRAALYDLLGDYGDRLITPQGRVKAQDLPQAVRAVRVQSFHDMGDQAQIMATRLYIELGAFTAACALFGVMILYVVARPGKPAAD